MPVAPTKFSEYVVKSDAENTLSVPADNKWIGVRTNGVMHRVIGMGGASCAEIEVMVQLIKVEHAVEIRHPLVIGVLETNKGILIAVQTG